ncbi:CHASE domain-containing protein, partial [Caenispirillum bisanense]|uniref:CHASE domain-containing protein n=1 Tax=Caenispirillum bisanense TaxID=414052 RepID=UPI0031E004E6
MRRSSGRGGGNGGRPVWAALAAFLVTALLLAGVERMVAASLTAAERASVTDRAATLRAQLETVVNRNVLLLRGMAAYIAGHPELSEEEFTTLARDLVTQGRHIRSMAFARGTTIAYIHPRAGNESAIGLDLSLHPEQREAALRAITARDVVVAGPVELVEGGTALIGRMPVHRSPAGGEPRSGAYVGLVTLPLDAAAIFAEAGLDAAGPGLAVALRGR